MIDSRVPRMAFISVDLPTFGLPTMLTNPARWSAVSKYAEVSAGATSNATGTDVASSSAMAAFFLSFSKKAAIRSSGSTAVSRASIRGTGSREGGKQRARVGVKEHAGRVATLSNASLTMAFTMASTAPSWGM